MIKEYLNMIVDGMSSVDDLCLKRIEFALLHCAERKYPILTIGNGGSAAIADHWSCDHCKGVNEDTNLLANVTNLASNMSLMTAIANDIGYEDVFSKQISYCQSHYAVVLAISSSGNSPNILKALETARKKDYGTIAFVGFDGGKVLKNNLADYTIHIKSDNYGVVEDCHQILMHSLAQSIRKKYCKGDPSTLKL